MRVDLDEDELDALADRLVVKLLQRLPQQAPQQATTAVPDWLNTKAAAEHLKIRPKTLEWWRAKGKGPRFERVGGTAVRYARADLEAFARARS